jgi:hypothetical protein
MTMSIRRYPRIKTNTVAELIDLTGNGEQKRFHVTELGQGGCLLRGGGLLGVGRVAVFELHFPAGKLRLISRVLYEYHGRDTFYLGVAFEGVEDEPPKILQDYIDAMLPHAASWLPKKAG